MAFCIAEGIALMTTESLYTQTYLYVKKGVLARVSYGVFKLGPKGAEIVGKAKSGHGRKENRKMAR